MLCMKFVKFEIVKIFGLNETIHFKKKATGRDATQPLFIHTGQWRLTTSTKTNFIPLLYTREWCLWIWFGWKSTSFNNIFEVPFQYLRKRPNKLLKINNAATLLYFVVKDRISSVFLFLCAPCLSSQVLCISKVTVYLCRGLRDPARCVLECRI
jgi:hypothetical protein